MHSYSAQTLILCVCISFVATSCIGESLVQILIKVTGKRTSLNKSTWLKSVQRNTGESCTSNRDCIGTRTCAFSGTSYLCVDPYNLYCTDSSDCLQGDVCYNTHVGRMCMSCSLFPSEVGPGATRVDIGNCGNSDGTGRSRSSVCIAVDSLAYFEKSALVFKNHKRAAVLCDQHENCATPGHIVVYQSKPMSMSTYCAKKLVSCSHRVKLVNSPRMEIKLRVPSKSKDLEFTALAAAKETRLEETVLSFAISIGI